MVKEILRVYPITPPPEPVDLSEVVPAVVRRVDEFSSFEVTSDIAPFTGSAEETSRVKVRVPEKWKPVHMQVVAVVSREIHEYVLRLQGSDRRGSYYDIRPFVQPSRVQVVYV